MHASYAAVSMASARPPAQPLRMGRREFLQLLGGVALGAGCRSTSPRMAAGTAGSAGGAGNIRAVAFDLFTIFDPRGVDQRVAAVVGDVPAFATTWKSRLFEYCFLRAASGKYVDFAQLVRDGLTHAAKKHAITLSEEQRARLETAFTELTPWPDSVAALERMKAQGMRLAPLANYAPSMIDALFAHAGIGHLFEARISTDAARTYKPDPRAYALAETTFGLSRTQIAFAAFGGWDAAGAKWFGLRTFWVNRLAVTPEELVPPDGSGPDLDHLASWLATTNGAETPR
jgi:2-haloacid dehalogenase